MWVVGCGLQDCVGGCGEVGGLGCGLVGCWLLVGLWAEWSGVVKCSMIHTYLIFLSLFYC